ncbi:MAG: type II toxin-antitoxin system RelE/ParE family toxin [Chloroflexi bacterium]|nr:type II toxin-antitoxin system RelE/ParE family toxin [Chloroflexota bacterium]
MAFTNEARNIRWVGDSRKQLATLPVQVRRKIGASLFEVQKGRTPHNAKPLKGIGRGIYEIIARHDRDTFRAVYAVQIGDDIYVLHVFQKKSKRGISTPPREIERIRKRYQLALDDVRGMTNE